MKPEPILAELNRLRKDIGEDPTDIEWLALYHAFVFISYQATAFADYIKQADERGEFVQFEEENV